MKIKNSIPASFIFLFFSAGYTYAQQIKLNNSVEQAISVVDTAQIKADITYLADDALKGRGPGTEGYQMAVDYVVKRLKSLNVKPAGDNGTWLQEVGLRKAVTENTMLSLTNIKGGELKKDNYFIFPNPMLPQVSLKAQMVFAGYGASEPSLGYDDYAGLDVKGKVVLIARGAPDKFSSSVSAHTMSTSQILKVAADHGAVGVVIGLADSAAHTPRNGRPFYSAMDKGGEVAVSSIYYSNQVSLLAVVDYGLFNSLLRDAGKTLPAVLSQIKSGQPDSFTLTAGVNASYTSTYKDIVSYNVIGKIEGTDPALKNEYIVHSAHLDHLGISTPVKGDSIYNGAHDNASGVATVLAIAGIYNNIQIKPRRSILTVLLTGEEMGDLGSGYFAKHPTVPPGSIVADINTDMPTIIAPLLSVTALGAEHSSLAKQVDQAAAYLGLTVEPDPEPKQARFTRSDQYSFVLEGIPALHIKYGSKTADGKNNLNDFVAQWREKYYHKPQDDINGIFDFAAGKKYAQLNFLIAYLAAQDIDKPTWNAGDIFAPQ